MNEKIFQILYPDYTKDTYNLIINSKIGLNIWTDVLLELFTTGK